MDQETQMDRVFAHDLNRRGGAYLGAAREWLQSNVNGGDQVRWASQAVIHITVRQFEEAAAVIAAAAINADRALCTLLPADQETQMVEVFVCHKDNMRPDKPIPKAHTGFRRVVLASDYEHLAAAANEVLRQYMPQFTDSRSVDDCLVGLAAALEPWLRVTRDYSPASGGTEHG
jgi:hypothetical protein